ncbi:MAG: cell division protein FtsQ/DivIB [Enterococcus lacertideformus]|uniref:Cell division protein DivIB n=1 Tax=Enterococcus lacertideformus TaxID=2771493 RepID=A0A931AVN4_9ENTE|nr:cell division protein FtsQ/DivIB [Enterococcus lacertideformus]
MGKKKKSDKLPDQSIDENNLTPWQKANRKYLAEYDKVADSKENEVQKEETNLTNDKPTESSEDELKKAEIPKKIEVEPFEKIEQPKTGSPYNGSFLNRLPNLKNHRNKVLYRRLALIITTLSIPLIFLIYYVSPYSRLQAISVSGNETISSQTAIANTNLAIGGNVWQQYWHKDQYIAMLKKEQPRIETAQLHFKSINTFQLSINEYKEIALVMKDGQYYPVIENGKVLNEKVANPTKNLPILEGFTDNNKISYLVNQYNKLSSELQKAISEIKYTPKDSNKNLIQLNMNDGNQVIVNIQNLSSQMKYYSHVAKEMTEKGVIDMEVGIFSYPYADSSQEADSSIANATENSAEQEGSNTSDQSSESSEADQSDNTSETSQMDDNSSSSSSISTEN